MAVTSHQVKGNSDVPSLQHSETIAVLSWRSSFMIFRERLLNERTTVILLSCHLGRQGLVCSKCTMSPSPICSWLGTHGVRARMPPGGFSSRLRRLNRNIYSRGVCLGATWGNPAQLREFMKRFCSPTLVSASPTEMLPISKGISHNIRCLCVDKFRPGSLLSMRV